MEQDGTSNTPKGNVSIASAGGSVGIGTSSPGAKLDIQGGTVTTNVPALNITQTWNNAATTFDAALKVNVTNTASGGGSNLMDIMMNGSTLFSISNGGWTTSTNGFGGATFQSNWSDGTAYTGSSSTYTFPGASNYFQATNTYGGDSLPVNYILSTYNAAYVSQNAYMSAISTTGAASYTPIIAFGQQTGAASYSERMRIDQTGKVGIGTLNPVATLNVNGAIVSNAQANLAAVTSINFATGNVQTSTNSTNNAAFKICGMQPGGSYSLVLTAQPTGSTPTFAAYSDAACTVPITNFDAGGVALTTTSATTILTFIYAGSTVYAMLATGFTH